MKWDEEFYIFISNHVLKHVLSSVLPCCAAQSVNKRHHYTLLVIASLLHLKLVRQLKVLKFIIRPPYLKHL